MTCQLSCKLDCVQHAFDRAGGMALWLGTCWCGPLWVCESLEGTWPHAYLLNAGSMHGTTILQHSRCQDSQGRGGEVKASRESILQQVECSELEDAVARQHVHQHQIL